MLGLMYLGAAALYLALMFFVVRLAWRTGRADDGSILKASGYALVAFLVVYLLAFWNWVPTALTFRQMCARDAGFKTFTTPDKWRADNYEQIANVRGSDLGRITASRLHSSGFSRDEFFAGLLARETRVETTHRYGVDFRRMEDRIVDTRTEEILTHRVNYSIGSWEDARIWLTRRSCFKPDNELLYLEESFLGKLKGNAK